MYETKLHGVEFSAYGMILVLQKVCILNRSGVFRLRMLNLEWFFKVLGTLNSLHTVFFHSSPLHFYTELTTLVPVIKRIVICHGTALLRLREGHDLLGRESGLGLDQKALSWSTPCVCDDWHTCHAQVPSSS